MLKATSNYMLVKDDVGKSKPSVRDLPEFGYTYGKPPPENEEGVGALTSHWQFHKFSQKGKADKDFKKLNKQSTLNRVHTAQVRKFLNGSIISF